jgi:ABC-type nitrate/sulfonate/bicarbonate transport system substrate-binding protein
MWQDRNRKIYTFAVSCPLSTPYFLFWNWLKSVSGPPCTEMRIESIPPDQMYPLLKLGYLDGYCAGEPWGSVAVQAGVGACLETSATLAPAHPEKVLLVRKDFAQNRADEHERLIAALLEAAYLCDQPENRNLLCELLAQPAFVNAPVECLEPGLIGPFCTQSGQVSSPASMYRFYGPELNEPSRAKASWFADLLLSAFDSRPRASLVSHIFKPEIFRRAQRLLPLEIRTHAPTRPEKSALVAR